ncbi:hypothetical protein BUALT_Bualt13G0097200 [Buddleja alternifolia]|uniref:Laccase n=1 Tax=Buddleja alternifolia TaxID=168488 RepID=A0AAV6WTE9_9LAMI|nr:hypothetical protein BUALT_Bualt13G0097200 [Buddleja alternifolia]
MATPMQQCSIYILLLAFILYFSLANAEIHYHEFVVQATPVKRLCRTHNILTVNEQFPGPTLAVRDGDTLVINVVNSARYNVTLHWHGVLQMRTPWADGPEYVTQCPIQPGAIYGALIIYPKFGVPYPFPVPKQEFPILLGEWWDRDIISVLRQAQFTGAAPNVSNAYTINGQPGDLYKCSSRSILIYSFFIGALDTTKFYVNSGETVLLRIINAALNQELFFTVANHMLTVVGNDAAYNKPFTTRVVMIGPGQTTNVLLTADQSPSRYYMATRAYATAQNAAFDNTTGTAILEYVSIQCSSKTCIPPRPLLPIIPRFNDTPTVTAYTSQLRSLPSENAKVPTKIDKNLFFTVGLGLVNCTPGPRCQGPNNTRFAASMNNVSFLLPRKTSLLQAYYQNIQGVYTTDFPAVPPVKFDYTGNVSRALWQPRFGTKLYKLKFGSNVQIVLQDTAIVTTEDHPIHLHGYHFYVVGQGFGNFNPRRDTARFNLVDPPIRNTINVPVGGWSVIRFVADNPDSHLTWGLAMAMLVENGAGELQSIEPPPPDLPPC